MKTIIMLSAAILVAGCTHSGAPQASAPAQTQAALHEADLAAALSGRIAGPPQDCVNEADLGGNISYGRGVILLSGRTNDVVYVNRPPAGCPSLDFGRVLKPQTPLRRLCRGDRLTVFNPLSGVDIGRCSLGQFTPWRLAR
jgi:hypothetical protein